MKQRITTVLDKGIISYADALKLQQSIRDNIINRKQQLQNTTAKNVLILCEHHPVLTFGSTAKEDELFITRNELHKVGLDSYDIRRGGAITFHGYGQIVGYPILDLENFKTDVRWYIKSIIEVIIRTLADYQIESYYDNEFPGVWIKDQNTNKKKKICAVGVHLSRWVSNHGFAFNINNSMDFYNYFVPCGILEVDREVTTLQNELNRPIDIEEIKEKISLHFATVFETEILTENNRTDEIARNYELIEI